MSRQRFEMKPQSTGSESDYVVDFPGSDEDYGLCGGAEIFLCLSLVLVKKRFLRINTVSTMYYRLRQSKSF